MNGNDRGRGAKTGNGSAAAVGPEDPPENHANGAGVAGILDERIRNLRDAIQEIDDALARRKVLNFRFLEQIDHERDAAMRQLDTSSRPGVQGSIRNWSSSA